MKITFDGLGLELISSENEVMAPRISSVVLLSGDTHIQIEAGKFGTSLSYNGVAEDWMEIVTITGKLGMKGTLVTPSHTFNNCTISSFAPNKIRGDQSKYKYAISFIKEGGGL